MNGAFSIPVVTMHDEPENNDLRTAKMLSLMRDQVTKYTFHPQLRAALAQVRVLHDRTPAAYQLPIVFDFLKKRIPYVRDSLTISDPVTGQTEYTEESIRSPLRTIVMGEGGDCDCMSVAAGATLRQFGYHPTLRAIAYKNEDPYSHVFVVIPTRAGGLPFDLTAPRIGVARPFQKYKDLTL